MTSSSVLLAAVLLGLEQLAQNRNVAEARHLGEGLGDLVVQQAGDDEALAAFEFDFGLDLAALVRAGNGDAHDVTAVGVIERADLRRHLHADGAARRNHGQEIEPDAVFAPGDA